MHLLAFPLEVLEQIFLDFVQVRTFKRAMRLRLVSRQFRYHINEAIFRSRILNRIILAHELHPVNTCYNATWVSFVQTYLARRIFLESDRALPGVRIRLVAERICELTGDTSDAALIACIRNLCGLAFFDGVPQRRALIKSTPGSEVSEDQFKADLIDSAVYMNLVSLANSLLSERPSLDPVPSKSGMNTILEKRLVVAAYNGNIEMIQLLLEAEPTIGNKARLLESFSSSILLFAAIGGHCGVFNFALDNSEPFELSNPRMSGYSKLKEAIRATAFPDNYKRGAAMFGAESEVFSKWMGETCSLVSMLALAGAGSKCTRFDCKPLLRAIESRNVAIVKLMLEHGADPNWYAPEETALMAAVNKGSLAIARMLVDYGAEVNDGTPPPIVLAVRSENMEIFRYLREKGAVLNTPKTGAWAMTFAKFYGLDSMIAHLVQEGVEEAAVLHRVPSMEEAYAGLYTFRHRDYAPHLYLRT